MTSPFSEVEGQRKQKRADALYFKIPEGKKAIGDNAYKGEAGRGGKISVSHDKDSSQLKNSRHVQKLDTKLSIVGSSLSMLIEHATAFKAMCVRH